MSMPPSVDAMNAMRDVVTVNEQREVKLLRDRGAFLDIKTTHETTLGACLVGDERHAKHTRRFGFYGVDGLHDLHAAALAAATGMDLGFHHPDRTAEIVCGLHGFVDRECGDAARNRNAKFLEDSLGLIFVNVHL
jgi:hypothetical protein